MTLDRKFLLVRLNRSVLDRQNLPCLHPKVDLERALPRPAEKRTMADQQNTTDVLGAETARAENGATAGNSAAAETAKPGENTPSTPTESDTVKIIDDDGDDGLELAKMRAGDGAGAPAAPPAGDDDHPMHGRSALQKSLGIMSLALAMVLYALDATMVSTALPTIVNELQAEDLLTWVGTSYMLTSTAISPLWGKLGEMIWHYLSSFVAHARI